MPRSESELLASADDDILVRLGIGSEDQLAETGFASASAKFVKVENVLSKLFKLYNREIEESKSTTELEWLMSQIQAQNSNKVK